MEIQKIENNKKKVVVLVAGLSGISAASESNLPVEVTGLLTRFADDCESVVTLYGGMMERESGERIMAFFGLEEKSDHYPFQSVQAALEIRARIEMMLGEQELPDGIGFRAGMATGEVITGIVGTGKNRRYTVIGSPVEMASRIQDLAEAGQILAEEEIFLKTRDQFEYRALEPMHIKGQKKPVAVYELAGKKKEIKTIPAEAARMISSVMVGREQEARMVEEMIKQLLNGRGGVLNIEGAGGIGKSRLIAEIKNREIIGNIAFFEGRALSEGKNLSFHPIIQLIKSWAGITDDDKPAASFQKLSKNINRIYPEQATEIIPFVATMMGYTLEGEARQRVKGIEGEALEKLILKNVRDLLSRATNIRPIAILVEDAHWADLSSISFMESLFKLTRNHRLLFINVFRPGFKETGEHLKAFVKENLPEHGREITLKLLTEAESAELIGNLLNQINLPEDIKNLIIQRSEGNPFFIEEVIRSFIDEGLVEVKDGIFLVTEQIQYANIPETIDKVILSRIERLDEKTKSLLKTASVIGRNFYYKVLEEAAQTIEEIDSRLEYLKETQLLNEHKHKEDVEFLFKHALAQQATYDSILQKTKKELHLKIARSIEKVFADKLPEFYGVLAMHYGKAEIPEKMEEYLFKAGEKSLAAGASSEAINYFKQALVVYIEHNKTNINKQKVADIEEKTGIAYAMKGLNLEAVHYFDRVLDFYHFHIPKNRTLRILGSSFYFLSFIVLIRNQWLFFHRKPPDNIETVYRMLLHKGEALTTVNPKRLFIESQFVVKLFIKYGISNSDYVLGILSEYSVFFSWMGLFFKTAQKILEVAHKTGVSKDSVFWLQYRVGCKVYEFLAGKWQEDPEQEYLYNLGLQKGAVWELSVCKAFDGFKLAERGYFTESMDIASRLFDLYDYFENSHARAQGYRLKSLNHLKKSKFEEVIKISCEGVEYTGKTNHVAILQVLHCHRCIAHSMRNEMNEALNDLLEAEKLVQQTKMAKLYICEYLLASCYYELNLLKNKPDRNKADVHPLLKQAGLLIEKSKNVPSHRIQGYRLAAIAYWMKNKQWKAYSNFEKSLSLAENLGANPELARTCFELGKCLMDIKSNRKILGSKNGSEYLFRAKSMFEEMDLKWDLQEYERYMEG
jgi:class 3 adenylate cyclase/tetratricopeptide (TPR) repeat protein